ncbi:MAG: amino acid adenylation domain-containing protein, partial [Acidobacteriota bacterium]
MQKVDEAPATVLLEELNLRRVKLRADGDQLRIRAPKGMLTPDLKRRLQQHKDSLLQLLRDRQAAADGASVQAPEPATETRFPLSPAQRRIWFLDRLEPGNSSYNIATILHLEGELQVTILARTLDEIRRRHATLRTTFEDDAEGPVQVVRPPTPVPLAPVDGSDWSTRRQEAWIERQIERPFDLERGPLFRCAWLQRGDRRHGLVLTLHHIVGDARSAVLLVRELEALYQAFSQSEPSPLADLPEQYAETIRPTVSGDNQRLLDYWRRQLTPLPRPLDLGGDRPPPDQRTSCGDRVVLALPSALGRALTALARRHDATLFMTLLAACTAHLYRLTGRHDLCVGVPIANRDRRDTEGLIGLFVDTLVLRTDIAGLADFPALLEQVRSTALEAFDHAALPFEELVAALKPPRDGHRMPLVQVMFNLADLTELAIELPNLRTEVELTMPGSRFDLTFYVLREGDDLRLEAAYSTDLFSRTRMLEWLDQYRRLLEQVATRSARSLHRLSLLTDDFAARLPAPAPPRWPADELAHQRFARQAQRLGDRVAVRDANSSWTYARLDREANQLAHHLRQHGIGREGVVALFADRRAELAWAMLGVLKAGAAFVVLDPDHPEQRLADVVHSLPVVGWIAFHHRTPAGALQAALADTDLRCRLDRPGAADAGWRAAPGEALPREPHPDDLAYVACTSGTTGRPLTIATPHRPLAHYLAWCEASFDLGGEDRFSLLAGLAHDPLLRDVLTPLWLGGTLCCPTAEERLAPGRLAPWMAREAISVSHLTPALGEVLTADDTLLPALRQAFCGGDRLRGALVERLRRQAPAARIVNLYGTTETPQAMGCHIVQEDPPLSEVPLGRGIDGVRLRIASPTDMLAGCGELGEILVETPFLARGYLGRPGRTAERFTPSPESAPGGRVYRTGDLGRWTPNGDVVFVRRRDRQLQIRGLRVEPTEIETVLERHPEVARAVVTARSEGTGDRSAPVLAAYFVGASGPTNEQVDGPARVDDLRQHLRAALPASLVPAVLIPLDALPLTANGKIDLEALPAPDPFSASDKPKTAPRHPLEAILLDLWAEILGLDGIGVDDDFFALGGHSLLATRLLSRIRQSLGHEVPLGRFFDRPTVSAVARYLTTDSTEGPKRPPLTAAASPTDQGLSFAQQRLWFVEQLQPESPAYLLARAFTLRGPLEPLALDPALRQIVHRHRPLRTAFPTVDGHPVADLGPVPRRLLARVDLTRLEVQARRRETRHHVAREARQPLDLAIGPLLRVTLLELEAQRHVLLLTLHHLAADASSITILRHELAELYGALREGRLVPGRDLELHYSDFAAWQRQCAESGCDETDLTYWRRQLADLPPFELPLGRPRRATTPPRGEACRLALAHDLTRSLRAVGRSHRATLFMTLLATFELLLSRLGASDDLAVGTAIDQRWRRRLEPLIGLFLNSLVLRTDLSGRPTFADLLGRVRQTVLDATVHQHVPFERLVDELLATRDLDRTPFFQVFCNLVDATAHRFELPGLVVEEWPRAPELTAKFDLALHLLDRGDAIECVLVYDGERFDRAPMHEILEQFRHLAQQVCQQPGKPIDAFELLRPEIAVHWPDPALPIPTPHHEAVPRAFLQQAYQAPERSAIRQGTHTLTYGHLAQQAQRLARTLIADGLRPGEVVALHGKRDIELVAALIGVQMSGGVLLLIDQDLPTARKRLMARQAAARFLLDLAPAPAEIWVDDAAIQRVDIVVGEPTTARLPQLDPAAPAY